MKLSLFCVLSFIIVTRIFFFYPSKTNRKILFLSLFPFFLFAQSVKLIFPFKTNCLCRNRRKAGPYIIPAFVCAFPFAVKIPHYLFFCFCCFRFMFLVPPFCLVVSCSLRTRVTSSVCQCVSLLLCVHNHSLSLKKNGVSMSM